PFRATEPVETLRFPPNPIELARPDVFKTQIRDGRGSGRAGKYLADWIDCEITLAPSVQAGFGPDFVIIWEHVKDVHLAGQSLLGGCRDFSRAHNLLTCWK